MDEGMADLPIVRKGEIPEKAFHDAVWGRVFNARRDGRLPRCVIYASTVAHVVAGVKIAADEGCSVAVRSGGHSWAAWSVREDSVLIDLSQLAENREFEYDERDEVVRAGPAATGRVLNGWLKTRGRFFAGGHCPDVGLGGFLLQGGMGWNAKNWGWSCESVVGVDVVTADAEVIHCSETENSDLFWAARGAGPGFPAIVTRFHLRTRPLTGVYQSLYFYPAAEFHAVLQWVIEASKTADEGMEIVCVGLHLPDKPDIHILANFCIFTSDADAAKAALSPMHESRPPGAVIEVVGKESSWDEQYCAQEIANPPLHRYCSDNAYLANSLPSSSTPTSGDAQISVPSVLEKAFLTLPTRKSCALYFSMYPTSRRPLPSMAFSMQTDHYFALYAVWEDEKDDERVHGWVSQVMQSVERHSEGSYLGDADFRVRGSRFWGPEEGRRIQDVKKKWDPDMRMSSFLDEGRGVRNEHDWIV